MSLPRILLAWDGGGNWGHAAKLGLLVRALEGRADVAVAAKDVAAIRRFAPRARLALLPAPSFRSGARRPAEMSFGANLSGFGWREPGALAALVESWRTLIGLTGAKLVVAHAAPNAMLAARVAGVPTLWVGQGFDLPPDMSPLPPFDHWRNEHTEAAAGGEALSLRGAGDALAAHGLPRPGSVREALAPSAVALACLPELDHYPSEVRTDPALGPLMETRVGEPVDWRTDRRRLFAYLRPDGPAGEAGVRAVATLAPEWEVIIAAPGLGSEDIAELTRRGVRHVGGPVRIDDLARGADLGLSHGSFGVVSALALAGVPQVALPNHAEQLMLCHALVRSGLGEASAAFDDPAGIAALLRRVDEDPRYREAARALGSRHEGVTPETVAARIAEMALALAG